MKTEPEFGGAPEDGGSGAHLRRAREAAGLTVGNVADALLLQPQTIEAIEADSFDLLPAPTFVRGYLRGYARVVGLPAEPILDMYDRRGFEPPPLDADVVGTPQTPISDTAIRLVTYAVAALLVLLVGLWWHSQGYGGLGIVGDLFDRSPDASSDRSLPAAEEAVAGTATIDGEAGGGPVAVAPGRTDELPRGDGPPALSPTEGAAPGGITASEPDPATGETGSGSIAAAPLRPGAASEATESPIPPPTEDVAAPAGIAADASAPAETAVSGAMTDRESLATRESQSRTEAEAEAAPAIGADAGARSGEADGGDAPAPAGTARADGAGESAGASLPAVTPPAVPATPSSETAPTDTGVATAPVETIRAGLVLEFGNESWVEVYDRERTRLFLGLVQPGRVLGFDGAQPFDVLLGSGEDVRVRIDGEAFDHKPYMKHGVARFSVGSAPEGDIDATESSGTTATDAAASPAESPQPQGRGG